MLNVVMRFHILGMLLLYSFHKRLLLHHHLHRLSTPRETKIQHGLRVLFVLAHRIPVRVQRRANEAPCAAAVAVATSTKSMIFAKIHRQRRVTTTGRIPPFQGMVMGRSARRKSEGGYDTSAQPRCGGHVCAATVDNGYLYRLWSTFCLLLYYTAGSKNVNEVVICFP